MKAINEQGLTIKCVCASCTHRTYRRAPAPEFYKNVCRLDGHEVKKSDLCSQYDMEHFFVRSGYKIMEEKK